MNMPLNIERPRSLTINNGDKVLSPFSKAEMANRLTGLRERMVTAGATWAVLTSMHNVAYYSGFLYTAFGRPYAMIVGPDTACTLSANIDGGQPARRSYCDNLVYTDWHRDAFEQSIANMIPANSTVAIEHDHLTLAVQQRLQHAMPSATLIDIAPATMQQRMVKSNEEIALIKNGAKVADIGGEACKAVMTPGISECEVAEAGVHAMNKAIAELYPDVEMRDTWVWFQSALNTDGAHNPLTTRKLQSGDLLSLNTFPMIAGYYTALERTLTLGKPDKAVLHYWNVNMEAYHAGLELIKPGAVCSEICAAVNKVFEKHKLLDKRTFGYGHSFGVLSHYYGREAGLELREDVHTVIEPNMVISMEPMIMTPEGQPGAGGYREHDIVVVHENGAENITGFGVGPEANVIPM